MSQNNSTPVIHAGVDVAKAKLDLSLAGARHCIANTAAGHEKLLRILRESDAPVHVILEATGGYEAALVARLHAEQIRLSVVQPARVRYFARAMNRIAKTDPIDADVLAAFGAAVRPAAAEPVRPAVAQLAELVCRREQLVESKVQHSNQAEHYAGRLARRQSRQMMALLGKQILECERAIAAHIAQDGQMAADNARLQQVKGVGAVCAATLLACMPELGRLSGEAAAALAGVAPYNKDSGPSKGTRSICGGRKEVRRVLYMAALSAVRGDSVLRSFYLRLRAKGKKPIVAVTAAMRKLIVLLNHMLKNPGFQIIPPTPKPQSQSAKAKGPDRPVPRASGKGSPHESTTSMIPPC